MKKIFMFMLLSLLVTCMAAIGTINNADLQVRQIVLQSEKVSDEQNDVFATVKLDNNFGNDIEDMKVTVVIPELGVRKSLGPFDMGKGDDIAKNVLLEIPGNVEKGEYDVKVTMGNENIKRVKYRTVTIG